MAKSVGLFGNFSGKLGNTIGYLLTNSKNRVTQGVRAYQPTVANPKTTAQANQRMKMAPATAFYRAFTDPIDHSFEGKKVGNGSKQVFMKYALAEGFNTVPAVPKDYAGVVPGKYLVSQGSLGQHDIQSLSESKIVTDIAAGDATISGNAVWGEVSQAIIDANIGVNDGDELCFLFLYNDGNGNYIPSVAYVVLDASSTQTISALGGVYAGLSVVTVGSTAYLAAASPSAASQSLAAEAGAVILSRRPRRAGGMWLRSTSRMNVSAAVTARWFTTAAYNTALASYEQSTGSFASDLTLNQAGQDATSGGSSSTEVSMQSVTIGEDTINAAVSNVSGANGLIYEEATVSSQEVVRTFSIGANKTLVQQENTFLWTTAFRDYTPKVKINDFLAAAPDWRRG